MNRSIEYNGHTIEATTRQRQDPQGWTLEVRITSDDEGVRPRRCRAPNTFTSKVEAIKRSLSFGRKIVDGKLQPKGSPS
jgi:hypothetical protein